ncbi:DUF4403 family protein [Algoriphagus sp. SE2]|uniref:DUF4403 family protein n=1 Tax=Algoriphagus sp. SE2 TaxID=3141536 RepID=UPI0031CD9459
MKIFKTNLFKLQPILYLTLIFLVACKSFNPNNIPPYKTAPPALSSVNVPVQVPQNTLYRIINQAIPQVLIDDENLSMGNVEGRLLISRNGKPTYVTLDSQRIQLTLPLKIQGELGLSKRGLGSFLQSKLPLNENLSPVIIVNPTINPDWSISIKDFELVDLGGQVSLNLLGMQVDLSGIIEKEITKWGDENLGSSQSIFSLKPFIDLAWNQVGKPFMIDWEGEKSAFSIQPESVRLKEYFGEDQNLNLWLGLNGKVNTHPENAVPSRAFPLPKITGNEDSENYLGITLPWVFSYNKLDQILGENLNNIPIRVDKKTILTPSNISSEAFGEFLQIKMDFLATQTNGKSLPGKIYVIGKPAYDESSQSLYFTDINFKLESGNLGAQTSVGLKKRKIIRQIEKRANFPIGETLNESIFSIQERLGIKTGIADLTIENLEIDPEAFYPAKNGLIVHIKANGKVNVDWK